MKREYNYEIFNNSINLGSHILSGCTFHNFYFNDVNCRIITMNKNTKIETVPDIQLYRYLVGLQLTSNEPEHIIEMIAKNSDEAWNLSMLHYRKNYNFTDLELTTMVLWNETKITKQ
jgi:hypothetical protein